MQCTAFANPFAVPDWRCIQFAPLRLRRTASGISWNDRTGRLGVTHLRRTGDCWFAYCVEPSIHFSANGIPCKPLPTADSGWTDDQIDTPQTITGTLLVSAATLTGYELGSNVLNPYRDFQKLKPVAFIQDGVFVYDGTLDMRFAAALGHVTRARDLTAAGQSASALVEAQTAVAIVPDELQAQMVLATHSPHSAGRWPRSPHTSGRSQSRRRWSPAPKRSG